MIGFAPFVHWVGELFRDKPNYFPGEDAVDLSDVSDSDDEDLKPTYEELLEEYKQLNTEDVDENGAVDQNILDILAGIQKEEDSKCSVRTGRVTSLYNESGLIDDNIYFDLRDAPNDLRKDDIVAYLAFRKEGDEVWQVRKIYPAEERSWDGGGPSAAGHYMAPDIPKDTCYRSELRQVTERKGREVIVNNGEFRFDLSTVSAMFTPLVGDFIYLDALVEKDEDVPNQAGEILSIDKIRWVRFKQDTGKVTKWFEHSGEGQVGSNVFFRKDACSKGYTPFVGDVVVIEIIESYQGSCSWRALSVSPSETIKKRVKNMCKASQSEAAALCREKNGITLSAYEFNFENVLKNASGKDVRVHLTNNGSESQVLLYGEYYKTLGEPQVFPVRPVTKSVVGPGQSVSYSFRCTGKHLGTSRELFVFTFKGFKVGCYFIVDVVDPGSSLMVSSGLSPVKSSRQQQKFYKPSGMSPGEKVLSGVKPIMPPKFIEQRLGGYMIPERYWGAVLSSDDRLENISVVQEAIEKLSPSLLLEPEIGNYLQRFHTLLYLEEIEASINLQRFNMDRVIFRKAGPAKDYLSLEVPGLAEKRPSLLVGDVVFASRPWKEDNLVFEGFIHKTLGKKVWIKFNADFHCTYNGDVFDVKFKFGRTAIRRQHGAIDMALTHLGPQMLFPSKLALKPPQLVFENEEQDTDNNRPTHQAFLSAKRKILWINPNLNCYQKEAVRNVLSGEARPLPYIIFGPPGTGKTMTLVELILQIFFLLPDSRMMIATPSNSSANLIAERLLDSDIIKPGDMVRLVGFHVLEEGTLPERLLPYATTGNIKSMTGEEAMPTPVGQLGESSNKSTLGRHRITIGTCIALGQLYNMGFPRGHFTHVLIDEAGQATEPEIMVPLDFLHCSYGQVVLAGDPMQLGPVVGSSLALKYGLGESYLDRLIHRFPYERDLEGFPDTLGYDPRLVTRLIKNYRSLPEILEPPNSLFYDSSLQPQVSPTEGPDAELLARFANYLPKRGAEYPAPPAILFHGIVGTNLQDPDSPSWFNPQETLTAMDYLLTCYSCGLEPDDVGIITPYRKQVQKMRWYYERFQIPLPKIGSVEEFQGQERKVIILSSVRSSTNLVQSDVMHSLGFVSSRKRLNVAITRARSLLVIIGNPHVLAMDRDWRSVIRYCMDRESYIGCNPPLDLLKSAVSEMPDGSEEAGCSLVPSCVGDVSLSSGSTLDSDGDDSTRDGDK